MSPITWVDRLAVFGVLLVQSCARPSAVPGPQGRPLARDAALARCVPPDTALVDGVAPYLPITPEGVAGEYRLQLIQTHGPVPRRPAPLLGMLYLQSPGDSGSMVEQVCDSISCGTAVESARLAAAVALDLGALRAGEPARSTGDDSASKWRVIYDSSQHLLSFDTHWVGLGDAGVRLTALLADSSRIWGIWVAAFVPGRRGYFCADRVTR